MFKWCFRKSTADSSLRYIDRQLTKEFNLASRTILVCQGPTCSLSGSAKILVALQIHSPPEVTVIACGCLGQCGNGPMVLFLPEETWYSGVSLDAVTMIIEQHLRWGKPIASLLYRQFHPLPSSQHQREANVKLGFWYELGKFMDRGRIAPIPDLLEIIINRASPTEGR